MPDLSDLNPIVSLTESDSSSLDNMLEVMRAAGMDVLQSMRILIPLPGRRWTRATGHREFARAIATQAAAAPERRDVRR